MNTLDFLREDHEYLWRAGDAVMSYALSCEPYDAHAQTAFKDGLATVRRANSLWPLIRWYRSFETSYWALRKLTFSGCAYCNHRKLTFSGCAYCNHPSGEIFELSWCQACERCYQKYGLHRF